MRSALYTSWSATLSCLCLSGGCNQTSSTAAINSQQAFDYSPSEGTSTQRPINRWSRQLYEMEGRERLAMLGEVIQSAGNACSLATSAKLKGHYGKTDYWHAGCADSRQWLVSISRDGSTKVLSCEIVSKLGDSCDTVWPVTGKRSRSRKL